MSHEREQADLPPAPAEEPGGDPFDQAAQAALAADPFLRERVDEAMGGLRHLLPAQATTAMEEMLVELFVEDPIVSGYLERLRPLVTPAATHERDVRTAAAASVEAAPVVKRGRTG